MSQRERQASGGTIPVADRPRGGQGAPPVSTGRMADPALSWDQLFSAYPPNTLQQLLTLARRQGYLLASQLPLPEPQPPDPNRCFLKQIFAGQASQLPSFSPAPLQVHDAALDPFQQEAVARALSTPDLFLIQGMPGTGKSRVIAEIVWQATQRGHRVLLLASSTAALDAVLRRVADSNHLLAWRCLQRGEHLENLSEELRSLTPEAYRRRLCVEVPQAAREQVESLQRQCDRLRQDELLAADFLEIADRWQQLQNEIARLLEHRDRLGTEVRCQVEQVQIDEGPVGPFQAALHAARSAHQERKDRLKSSAQAMETQAAKLRQQLENLTSRMEADQPLVEARRSRRWWSKAWWQAALQSDLEQRWQELVVEQERLHAQLSDISSQIRQAASAQAEEELGYQAELELLVRAEEKRRQLEVDERLSYLGQEQQALQQRWDECVQQLSPENPRPAALTGEAIRSAQTAWRSRREQAQESLNFARQWSTFLDESAAELANRLPQWANLLATTISNLPADWQIVKGPINEEATAPLFDFMVMDEAEVLTEADFSRLARLARRWVLVGQPALDPQDDEGPHRSGSNSNLSGGGFFQKLWAHLHTPPIWSERDGRIWCRLRPVPAEQRTWLEKEVVADFPDVELHILTPPQGEPLLAEVVFPATMSLEQAKQFIYRELQEVPVRTGRGTLDWDEHPERLLLRLSERPHAECRSVVLESGIREWIYESPCSVNGKTLAPKTWETCRLEFLRAAGWHLGNSKEWACRYLGVRDEGRSIVLPHLHRQIPQLGKFLADLLNGNGSAGCQPLSSLGEMTGCDAPVIFVPVPDPSAHSRRAGNGASQTFGNPRVLLADKLVRSRGGAGLELNLGDPRQFERLPATVRSKLPREGFANYYEAEMVLRQLNRLYEKLSAGPQKPRVAVLALYLGQVQLIRHLLLQPQAPNLNGIDLTVDLPTALCHQEADVVMVSLTRSHTHRAVSYAKSTSDLVLALTRARSKLVLIGDPGTLVRRTQWEGPVEHLDAVSAERERRLLSRLANHLTQVDQSLLALQVVEDIGP